MTRWTVRMAMAICLATTGGMSSLACSPLPPPEWSGWVEDPATDIFVGEVSSVTPLPETEVSGVRLRQGRLRITRMASFEGRTGPSSVDVMVVLEVLDDSKKAEAAALCLSPVPFKLGDHVLLMKSPGERPQIFSRAWVGRSHFAALFEPI